uniref:CSON000348 protein n=1 Tax=Culicoides sonorensis TaxID=179676 RepID=A0A336MIL5_CULSO
MDTKFKRPRESEDLTSPAKKIKIQFCKMAEWNLLPTELLINIFNKLDNKTRLNCKLVCSRWQEILMTDFEFMQDRTLDLRDYHIEKSQTVYQTFLNTKFNYNCLILNHETTRFEDFEDVREFWETLGQHITSVKYQGLWDSKMVIILSTFENMSEFETELAQLNHGTSQMSKSFLSKAFKDVNVLHIDRPPALETLEEIFHTLDTLYFGKHQYKCKVHIDKKVEQYIEKYNTNLQKISTYEGSKHQNLESLGLESDIQFIDVSSRLTEEKDFTFLNDFVKHQQNVKKIHLTISHIPRQPLPNSIESLILENVDPADLDRFMAIPELKKAKRLTFNKPPPIKTLEQVFTSSVIYNNIEYLSVRLIYQFNDSILCHHCNCAKLSNPNMSLASKFPNLKELDVDFNQLKEFFESNLFTKDTFTQLKKLTISGYGPFKIGYSLVKVFPQLTELNIKFLPSSSNQRKQTVNEVIWELRELIPNLTCLEISPEQCEPDSRKENLAFLRTMICARGRKLKTLKLILTDSDKMTKENLAKYFFRTHTQLNLVKFEDNTCKYYRSSFEL